jgi:hypothetical protein
MEISSIVRRFRLVLPLSFAAAVGLGLACHDPGVVGGSCDHDRECADLCVEGKDFPDGTCTVECRDDRDCPGYAACVKKEGGICLPLCDHDGDCREKYSCQDVDREGASGEAPVCIH